MPINFTPVLVTSSMTISLNNMVYIVTPSANMILTLPQINCDGIKILFKRTDMNIMITVNISITIPNTIIITSNKIVNTFSLPTASVFELVSINNSWYASEETETLSSAGGSLISGTLTANNSNCYKIVDGGSIESIALFGKGSSIAPKLFMVTIFNINAGNIVGNLDLINSENVYMRIQISSIPPGYSNYSTDIILISPVPENFYEIMWVPMIGGSNRKIGLCSIRII